MVTRRDAIRASAAMLLAGLLAGCAGLPSIGPFENLETRVIPVDVATASASISAYRARNGLGPVTVDAALVELAQRQANAMARGNDLSHTIDGPLMARIDGAGFRHGAAIENVSGGYDDLPSAIESWRKSPGHDANLRNPLMRRMGIAAAIAPKSKYKFYWALIMTD